MLFELHAHSWYSKDKFGGHSFSSPIELVKMAKRKGLHGIAITDHDSFRAWDTLKQLQLDNFFIIPAEEISTKQGHMLAFGINEEIRPGMHFLDTIDKIHAQGGIAVSPHPFDLHEAGLGERAQHTDAIEVFNSMNLDIFSNIRAKFFARFHKKGMIAGSDAHTDYMIGRSVTQLASEPDIDSLLKAIKSGKNQTLERYHPVHEMTNWYIGRLNSNPALAEERINGNHSFFKQKMLRFLMEHKKKNNIFSKSLVYALPYVSTAGSAAKSFIVNGPACLM